MADKLKAVKGMNDIRPGAEQPFLDSALWQHIVDVSGSVLDSYGYHHARIPIVEHTSLFARGIGEGTDIVSKEMYTFESRGGRSLTLRPEGTAGAARAYVEHNLSRTVPQQRWWYFGPMFRAERPQQGRYRQFYQIGAELFGPATPEADAEVIAMLWDLCQRLGVKNIGVRINSLGDAASRAAYRTQLLDFLRPRADALCDACRGRMDNNPLRVLDCKVPACKEVVVGAPVLRDAWSDAARSHFERVQELLGGLDVPAELDDHLVRGLDYYTGTLFEFTSNALGAQDAILGGGRYDELVSDLGGPPTPAIGFAAGVERLALLLAKDDAEARRGVDLYLVPMGDAVAEAMALAMKLRTAGRRIEVDVAGGKLKQQMKRADRSGAKFALVLGESELESGQGRLKDLGSGEETGIELDRLAQAIGDVTHKERD